MKINPFATIKELKHSISSHETSADTLLDFSIDRFKKYDSKVGSALEIFEKKSILGQTCTQGMLSGIPGILKDNISQKDRRLGCASKILDNFVSPYDSTASLRLKQDGALLIGRGNCDEFAMGTSGETSAFKKTANPWNLSRVAGGSSSGPIAAVAAGFVPWSLGSETGGSVRLPAAFCGVVGLKPTYGLISRYGLVAYGSSLDQIGISTRTVYDNAMVLSTIAGQDLKDSTSLAVDKKDYTELLNGSLRDGLRIGIVDNAMELDGIDPEIKKSVQDAVKQLEDLGATIVHLNLPAMDYTAAAYFIISRAEAASNLARFDGVRYGLRSKDSKTLLDLYENTRYEGFGDEVKRRIMVGNYVLSSGHQDEYYGNARKVQQAIRREFEDAFKGVDLLAMPTHSIPAFKFDAFKDNKLAMDLLDYFTLPINLAGIPALSVPCGFTKDNLPIGFQLVGAHLSEQLIYQTAHAYEQATPWHTMHPQGFE